MHVFTLFYKIVVVEAKISFFNFSFQFDAEFRRFSLGKDVQNPKFDDFYKMLENMHRLANIPFLICYTDPNGDLLPINNDDNYKVALCSAKPMLRLLVQRKGRNNLSYVKPDVLSDFVEEEVGKNLSCTICINDVL